MASGHTDEDHPVASPASPPQDRRPIIISGPSGVGKGTLSQMLFAAHPGVFTLSISHTTRNPRPGETEGNPYFYVSPAAFASLVDQDAFVEHAVFSGNSYGTSKRAVADLAAQGRVVVLDIDVQGVQQIRERRSLDARYLFVRPPSVDALEARLRRRGTESEEDVLRRLARASSEMEAAEAAGVFDKVVVNDSVERAYEEVERWVFDA